MKTKTRNTFRNISGRQLGSKKCAYLVVLIFGTNHCATYNTIAMPSKPRRAVLLAPRRGGDGSYAWDDFEVRASGEGPDAGLGLFATRALSAGLMVPIVGELVASEEEALRLVAADEFTHGYQYDDGRYVDARAHLGGLAIWARANEPTRKRPNCVYKLDCLVTARRVRKGEELVVYYGDAYTRRGYSLAKNRFLGSHYPELDGMRWPPPAERKAMRDALNKAAARLLAGGVA